MQDHFKQRAEIWDKGSVRVQGAQKIADAISKKIELNKSTEIMDFGVGTGLLGFEIDKKTKKVYGVDTSENMLEKLKEKNTKTCTRRCLADIIEELQEKIDAPTKD